MIGKRVVVRDSRAGVFFGTLRHFDGPTKCAGLDDIKAEAEIERLTAENANLRAENARLAAAGTRLETMHCERCNTSLPFADGLSAGWLTDPDSGCYTCPACAARLKQRWEAWRLPASGGKGALP